MSVAFLTEPSVTPPQALAELADLGTGRPPELLVARVPTAKALLTLVEKLETVRCPVRRVDRGPSDPLVAVWLADAHENPEPLAFLADVFLLGGGWGLLRAVVEDLRASRALARTVKLERLAHLAGAYVPQLFAVDYREDGAIVAVRARPGLAEPLGLQGGAPFESDLPSPPLRHPHSVLGGLVGEAEGPETEAEAAVHRERVHLRFAVGLAEDEPEAIAGWVKRFRHLLVARSRGDRRPPAISVSLTCFVPRPWTALQWAPMLPDEALKARLSAIRRELSRVRDVTLTHDLPKWALLEGILARGDRGAGELLLAAVRMGWDRARLAHPLNPAFVLHRERGKGEILPWDHLRWGIDREALWADYERART